MDMTHSNTDKTDLATEWALLQNQNDSYEKCSLAIKLLTITASLIATILTDNSLLICSFIVVFWLQDAIWKTFQARIERRLVALETALAGEQEILPFQYNRDYIENRPSTLGLIKEYARQSLRPTVATPYLLVLASVILI